MTVAYVTGASGFIGGALARWLDEAGWKVRRARRDGWMGGIGNYPRRSADDLARALEGVDVIYHLAGLTDAARGATSEDFDGANRQLTLRLFGAARTAGVRHFVWMSTIKVLGEVSHLPLQPDAVLAPVGHYALSKARAERELHTLANASTSLAIVRTPLVYGPGVKGNFATLMRLCGTGLPLPLARATAHRSMLGLANLVDFLARLPTADLGRVAVLHARDTQDWRVSDLVAALQGLYGHPRRQFPLARAVAEALATPLGKRGAVARLFDPLRVDAESSQRRIGWRPPHSSIDLLRETVAWTRRGL